MIYVVISRDVILSPYSKPRKKHIYYLSHVCFVQTLYINKQKKVYKKKMFHLFILFFF